MSETEPWKKITYEKEERRMIIGILAIIKTVTIMLQCAVALIALVAVYCSIGFSLYILTNKKVNIVKPILKKVYSFMFL